ncbi:G-protein coupled receptor 161-like [Ruditapes philippinarum]|uniref:G-protein coupled receptor 161-like n=1 Tax=Ruditapes philippinarum TaxID=129788 RepID=UPI00295BCF80|nr:G-protein coupled receptor 161-like [Ruditapes philippinarum]
MTPAINSNMTSVCNDTNGICSTEKTENTEVWRTLMAVYLGAILFISLAFNGTLCLMFYKKSHLLSVSNCFVLNLICCQLLTSLLVLPFSLFAVVSQDWIYSGHWCEIQGFFFTTVVVAQQLALLIISIDRNYAIMNSLRYPNIFTQTLCSILIAISWTLAVIISIPPLLSSGMGNYSFHRSQFLCGIDWATDVTFLVVFSMVTFAIPVLIQSFCYVKIFIAAVGHSKRTSKVNPLPCRPSRTTSEMRSDSSAGSSEITEEIYRSSAECKAVRTILIIALAYSVCWLPYFLDSFLTLRQNKTNPNFSAAAICCLFSSSILNPMIYAYMNRVTRREIGRFVCGNSGMTDPEDAGSTSMSAYSSVWGHNRVRSKSNGAVPNEMDTIAEEGEVDESVFCQSHSRANRVDILSHNSRMPPESQSKDHVQLKEKITFTGSNCVIEREENHETEYNIPRIAVTDASGSDLEIKGKYPRDSSWKRVKTELRKSSKSNESYFSKEKRRKRRDCGSFLYFNNCDDQPGTKTSRNREKRRPQRFSVDHVQNISVGKFPSYMKFRLSLNDTELHNVDKFMVESKIKLENSACSNNCAKDIMIMPKKKSNRSTTTELQSTSKSDNSGRLNNTVN